MRILLLSDINSAHTQKWATALAEKGLDIAIFSMSQPDNDWFSKFGIRSINSLGINKKKLNGRLLYKLSYIMLLPNLRSAIAEFKPEIIHSHYASSYGLLGALSGFHPFIISAWGSDVMEFPHKNLLNKKILKYNLKKSDYIFATSDAIVKAIAGLSNKTIKKIPFGIDTSYFIPTKIAELTFPLECIVIGTVKSLEEIYGIDLLIKAFKKVNDNNKNQLLKLLIVGSGSKTQEYNALVKELQIADNVLFTGKVEYSKVVNYHNMIDIFVNVSRSESFGVSVLEASSCGKPVIVSNTGGLPEVVVNGKTGFLVESQNIDAIANAIEKLIGDEKLRSRMGENGRIFVQEHFDFRENVNDTLTIYKQLITTV
ncbi:MAG: glycosyltransferase [Bacteroidota bacterium]